jgi:hypothetical protein
MKAERYLARLRTCAAAEDRLDRYMLDGMRASGRTARRRILKLRRHLAEVDAATAKVDQAIRSGVLTPRGACLDSLPTDSWLRCDPAHDRLVLAVTDATTMEEYRLWRDEGPRIGVQFLTTEARQWLKSIAPPATLMSGTFVLTAVRRYADAAVAAGRDPSENGACKAAMPLGASRSQVKEAWKHPDFAKYQKIVGGKAKLTA